MRRAGGNGEMLELDVLDVEAVRSAFSARPSYDILVNNAGTNRPIPFLNVEPDDFDAVCSLNVGAAFFVAQVVARGMVETGRGGSIIHMSSQMGHVGGARRTLYCASKWAVEGLSKAMALDLAPHKIRVNTIARSEEHTSELQSLMRNSYAAFCLKNKIKAPRHGHRTRVV